MVSKRGNANQQKPYSKGQQRTVITKDKKVANHRKEKLADFLIDVAKYVFTGVLITSLFNDVTNKAMLYVIGFGIVVVSIWGGLKLTNKRKEYYYGSHYGRNSSWSTMLNVHYRFLYAQRQKVAGTERLVVKIKRG